MSAVPPPRPAFLASKFVQNQFVALAKNSILRKPILTMYGSYLKNTGASAMVAVEGKGESGSSSTYRDGEDEDPDLRIDPNTRVLFAVRPPPHLLGGVVGCCWNVTLGQIGSPLVAATVFWSTMNRCAHGRYIGALWGVGGGMFWGLCFALMGGLSGAQQLCTGFINQVAGPYYALVASGGKRRFWSSATCQFIAPRTFAQPEVLIYRGNDELILEAMRRQSVRSKQKEDSRGFDTKFDRDGNLREDKKPKKRERTYYDILNINKNASDREIKEAYAKLAMKLHPDRNPSPKAHEDFDELTKAYRTLGNSDKRKRYDAAGIAGADDVGSKKRTAVRSFFGGDDLAALVGEVRRNNFNRRFIDETDFPITDLNVLNERIEDGCVRELLDKYLAGYPLDPRIVSKYQSVKTSKGGAAPSEEGREQADDAQQALPLEVQMANYEAEKRDWEQRVKKQILKYANVALAKEVMHAVGQQYMLTMQLAAPTVPRELLPSVTDAKLGAGGGDSSSSSASSPSAGGIGSSSPSSKTAGSSAGGGDTLFNKPSPIRHTGKDINTSTSAAAAEKAPLKLNLSGGVASRTSLYATVVLPRFLEQNTSKITQLFKLNPSAKDPAVIMDFVWRLSVTEIQQTAHRVATRVLCDIDADDLERRRRLSALIELSMIFVSSGRKYSTVDKRTMEMMTDSLRDYYNKTGKSQ